MKSSKKYVNEDNQTPSTPKTPQPSIPKEPDNDVTSGSCFSDEAAQTFKKHQEEKKGNLSKLASSFSKSFIPPTETASKWRDLQIRTIWSLIMIALFGLILAMGHFYCAVLVMLVIVCSYYELIDIPRYKERNSEVKYYYSISWYIFFVGIYYLYIRMLKEKIIYLSQYSLIYILFRYHNFICFMMYAGGFFMFILSLTKGYYRYQFRQFAYIHIILLIFGVCSSLIISNIFNGLVWFLIPVSLVIVNDISAYIWGRMFGRHQLTPLSPKKTWEGFIGALFTTLVWCYFFTETLIKYESVLCPVNHIGVKPFEIFNMNCDISEFRKEYELTFNLIFLGKVSFAIKALHFHTFFFGLFASLYAPLGGLFASGFKRAIKIKDFADTIPGHGGFTDRMDCQLLMGLFTYVWLSQFMFYDEKKAMNNLVKRIDGMSYEDKLKVFQYLKQTLGM